MVSGIITTDALVVSVSHAGNTSQLNVSELRNPSLVHLLDSHQPRAVHSTAQLT